MKKSDELDDEAHPAMFYGDECINRGTMLIGDVGPFFVSNRLEHRLKLLIILSRL